MTLHFQYNKKKVIEALRFHFLQRPEIKVFRYFIMLLVIAAFFGFFTHFITLQALIWIFISFILLTLFIHLLLPFSVYRKAHTFREPELTLDLSEHSLTIATHRGKSRIPWQKFSHVVETKDFFYLYRTNKSFFLIPASAFDRKEDRISFSEMLQKQLPNYLFK